MTPREPDRYTNAEWQRAARILDACLNGSHEHDEGGLVLAAESWRPIAAALRAAESSALERAARIARRYSHHAEREIRALIPPAAASEGQRDTPCAGCGHPLWWHQWSSKEHRFCSKPLNERDFCRCKNYQEPAAAPAAETGKAQGAEARIAELETAIRWALGEEGEFRAREPGEGAFWWRIELRKRAGGWK